MTIDEFGRAQRVDVEGGFLMLRAAVRHITAHGQSGSLVVTASTPTLQGAARSSHCGAGGKPMTSPELPGRRLVASVKSITY